MVERTFCNEQKSIQKLLLCRGEQPPNASKTICKHTQGYALHYQIRRRIGWRCKCKTMPPSIYLMSSGIYTDIFGRNANERCKTQTVYEMLNCHRLTISQIENATSFYWHGTNSILRRFNLAFLIKVLLIESGVIFTVVIVYFFARDSYSTSFLRVQLSTFLIGFPPNTIIFLNEYLLSNS